MSPSFRRLVAASVLSVQSACAQSPQDLAYACAVVRGPDAFTLQLDRSSADHQPSGQIIRSPSGKLITGSSTGGLLMVFDSLGRFLRTVARPGDGPGELAPGVVSAFSGPNGSVYVRDNHLHWVVFDSLFNFVGNLPLGPMAGLSASDTHILEDGRVIASFLNPSESPNSIVVYTPESGETRRFAPLAREQSIGMPRPRASTYVRDGVLWVGPEAGPRDGYVIEVWDTIGRRIDVISRDVPWFERQEDFRPDYTEGRGPRPFPFPSITRLHFDGRSHVWVFAVVPRVADARAKYARAKFADLGRVREEALEVRVEVIDVNTKVVVAGGTLPLARMQFEGLMYSGTWAYRVTEDSIGNRAVVAFELQLLGPEGARCGYNDGLGSP